MFKKTKRIPQYKLTDSEREKVRSLLERLERASEEVVAARAIFQAMLQSTIQARGVRAPEGHELVFNFDELVIYAEPVKQSPSLDRGPGA